MKELDKIYFSNLTKIVNHYNYNFDSGCIYDEVVAIEDIFNEKEFDIKAKINEEGFVVLKAPSGYESDIDLIGKMLMQLFGKPITDKNPAGLSHAEVKAEENSKYYINSHLAQPMHTDEGYTCHYPRYVALYCLQPALLGGESILVQLKFLYHVLKRQFGDKVNLLFKKDAITVYNARGMEKKPILMELENKETGISYSPVLQKMHCCDAVFQQYEFITSYIHDLANQIRFKLKEGQILLFDNCRVLHGRTFFPKNSKRLLYRYWFGKNILC